MDLRIAVRKLGKHPGFLTVALFSLALGIGANTAVFSLLDAVLLRPLAVHEPERLAAVFSSREEAPYRSSTFADYVDYAVPEVFSGLAAYRAWEFSLATQDASWLLAGELVSGNYFDVLGVQPALGKSLLASSPEAPAAIVVIGHRLWRRAFASDPHVIGRDVRLSGQSFTIVGVAPEGFRGPSLAARSEIWVPLGNYSKVATGFWSHFAAVSYEAQRYKGRDRIAMWQLVGRLLPQVSWDQARLAMAARDRVLSQEFPATHEGQFATLVPATQAATPLIERGDATRFVLLLLAAVGMALLIACTNVANLLLARADHRRQEIGIRLAVGADRWRLIRQLLTESLVLALLGGGAGLLMASWAFDLLAPFQLPGKIAIGGLDLAIDGRVFAFTFTVSILTGVLFGLAPALTTSRGDAASAALQGWTATAGRGSWRFRSALIAAQVGLSLVLLVSAGLFVRSLRQALATDLGFDARGILTLTFDLGLERYDASRAESFYGDLLKRVRSLPGVREASVTSTPFGQLGVGVDGLTIEGRGHIGSDRITLSRVGAAYFETLGIPLLAGRGFDHRDADGGTRTLIISETMARAFWPGQNAVGQRIHFASSGTRFFEIVGIAADRRHFHLTETPQHYVYMPLSQHWAHAAGNETTLLARTASRPADLVGPIGEMVRELDPHVPIVRLFSLRDRVAATLMPQRMGAAFLGFFSLMALVLAAIGIFGVIAYATSQRTREIGLRLALGARPSTVTRLFLWRGLAPVTVGIAAGLAVAAATARLLESFLYEVTPLDPATYLAAAATLLGVAAAACWLPARAASQLDPTQALRQG